MRKIFSTVRRPHEPAFTVESFAMIATVRPAIFPVPVTTPSAGKSGSWLLASSASSTKVPASTNRAMRSRAKSFPCSAFFWWYFGAPPFSARSSASRSVLSVDIDASEYHNRQVTSRRAIFAILLAACGQSKGADNPADLPTGAAAEIRDARAKHEGELAAWGRWEDDPRWIARWCPREPPP